MSCQHYPGPALACWWLGLRGQPRPAVRTIVRNNSRACSQNRSMSQAPGSSPLASIRACNCSIASHRSGPPHSGGQPARPRHSRAAVNGGRSERSHSIPSAPVLTHLPVRAPVAGATGPGDRQPGAGRLAGGPGSTRRRRTSARPAPAFGAGQQSLGVAAAAPDANGTCPARRRGRYRCAAGAAHADLLGQPAPIDYPAEVKRWRVFADQARHMAELREQPAVT